MVKKVMVLCALSYSLLFIGKPSYAQHERKKVKFFPYIWSKIIEIPQMKLSRDLRLAQVNRHIRRKYKSKKFSYIKVNRMLALHPISRSYSLIKLEKRIEALKKSNLRPPVISYDQYQEVIPSITPIQVAKFDDYTYYVFEGNGRLVALMKSFSERSLRKLKVEVEVYDLTGEEKLRNKILVLRRKNGFTEPEPRVIVKKDLLTRKDS